jgi:hypothetical protein
MSDAAAQMAGALRAKIDALKAESAALAQNERAMQSAQTAAAGFARSLVAAVAGGVAFREFVQAADAVTTLNNQLKLATGSADAAKQAYGSLYEIAQRSRVSFTELGTTYASIARSTGEMGISQQRLLKVTESIGNAMTISGGSAQGMQAALVQLGQGFASGTLRGEALNSVMEQTPRGPGHDLSLAFRLAGHRVRPCAIFVWQVWRDAVGHEVVYRVLGVVDAMRRVLVNPQAEAHRQVLAVVVPASPCLAPCLPVWAIRRERV